MPGDSGSGQPFTDCIDRPPRHERGRAIPEIHQIIEDKVYAALNELSRLGEAGREREQANEIEQEDAA